MWAQPLSWRLEPHEQLITSQNCEMFSEPQSQRHQLRLMNLGRLQGGMDICAKIFFFLVFLPFLGPLLRHMGCSQARGPIGAVATGLSHGHSNAGSEPRLQPTPRLTAMPDC